ncbi:MAG: hypothetical protein AB7P04_12235 [Bacteriovoracia bacterium]
MSHSVIFELEHNRQRLNYYQQQKTKPQASSKALDKWIDIYSERVKKLERQATKLKLELPIASAGRSPGAHASLS